MDPEDRALEKKHIEDALKTSISPMGNRERGKTNQEETNQTEEEKETHKLNGEQGSGDTNAHQRSHQIMRKYT